MHLAHQIGTQLKKERLRLGYTQSQMVEYVGLSLNHYGAVERGKKMLSLETFVDVCKQLNLDPSFVLTGEKSADTIIASYLADCPSDKRFDLEQLIRYASNLYR